MTQGYPFLVYKLDTKNGDKYLSYEKLVEQIKDSTEGSSKEKN